MTKEPAKNSCFVTSVDVNLAQRMIRDLESQGFIISKPAYTLFAAKKKGVSCTLYTSGKLMVQGKEMQEFIEFYLEPNILQSFEYSYSAANLDTTTRIGIDEAGKGDFFGPLCIAGVHAGGDTIAQLQQAGVRDSKNISDPQIIKIAVKIRQLCRYHIVRINPAKYNELYAKFKNLNHLLAWGHATCIEALVQETGCKNVIVDQFANESVVLTALSRKKQRVDLHQRPRAESDLVVAAASILARDAFLWGLKGLSERFGMEIPKGASSRVITAARAFAKAHGQGLLTEVCKIHFKTYNVVIGQRLG